MDNDTNSQDKNSQSDLIPEVDAAPSKAINTGDIKPVRARKTPKPLVEGINTPVTDVSAGKSSEPSLTTPISDQGMMQSQSTVVPPKITLTNSEKQLIEETLPADSQVASAPTFSKPKIFPAPLAQKLSLPGKKSSFKKIGLSLLMSLLAVCVVFGVLLWYNNKGKKQSGGGFSLFPTRPELTVTPTPIVTPTPTPTQNATTTPSTTPTPAASAALELKVTNTPTGYLNVRNAPTTSGKQLTQVHPGETYVYTKTQNGWYYITLADKSQGWVIGRYVELLPAR